MSATGRQNPETGVAGDNEPVDEGVSDKEWREYLRGLTPGQRLAVQLEHKAHRKRLTRDLRRGRIKRGADGKLVRA